MRVTKRVALSDFSRTVEEERPLEPEDKILPSERVLPKPRLRKQKINWGKWRVQQERACIDVDERPPPVGRVTEIGTAIPGIMARMGAAPDFWQERLQNNWREIVGPAIARNTRPGLLERGSLTVYVSNNTWLYELKQALYKEFLGKVQKEYGADKIRHLRLLSDPDVGRTMK